MNDQKSAFNDDTLTGFLETVHAQARLLSGLDAQAEAPGDDNETPEKAAAETSAAAKAAPAAGAGLAGLLSYPLLRSERLTSSSP